MKKLLLVVVGLSAVISCWAQGVIDFNNENLKPPPNPRVRFSNGAGVVGTNYVAQLFQGYALNPVPEPNVIPLTILGIAAVWLLRRKK